MEGLKGGWWCVSVGRNADGGDVVLPLVLHVNGSEDISQRVMWDPLPKLNNGGLLQWSASNRDAAKWLRHSRVRQSQH